VDFCYQSLLHPVGIIDDFDGIVYRFNPEGDYDVIYPSSDLERSPTEEAMFAESGESG
jgi:hypothetical protein